MRTLRSSRLLSISIRIIISIFALSMVFEVLGVAEQTMLIAFGTAFGAVMLGLGDCVRHRRQGSGAGVPGEKTRYGEKGGERGRTIASVADRKHHAEGTILLNNRRLGRLRT